MVLNMSGLVLIMPVFWIQQGSEYSRVPNMSRFWICHGSKYTRGLNTLRSHRLLIVPEYTCVIPEYAKMLNVNSTLLRPVSLKSQFAIFENSVKKNLHYFRKALCRRCLRKLWMCLRSWTYQGSKYGSGSKYARVLYTLSVKKTRS